MMFDEWWKQYLDNGGVTHFDLIANKESALAAWDLREKARQALKDSLVVRSGTDE